MPISKFFVVVADPDASLIAAMPFDAGTVRLTLADPGVRTLPPYGPLDCGLLAQNRRGTSRGDFSGLVGQREPSSSQRDKKSSLGVRSIGGPFDAFLSFFSVPLGRSHHYPLIPTRAQKRGRCRMGSISGNPYSAPCNLSTLGSDYRPDANPNATCQRPIVGHCPRADAGRQGS